MLRITFIPVENNPAINLAASVYQKIWDARGRDIIEASEKITGLKFRDGDIKAAVHNGPDRSEPLSFYSGHKSYGKRSALVHEVLHRLISFNGVSKLGVGENKLLGHKILDLILYDVWKDVFGRELADWAVNYEKSLKNPAYKEAWEWALGYDKKGRQEKFQKIVVNKDII